MGNPLIVDAYISRSRMAFTLASISFSLLSMSSATTPTTVPHESQATSLTPGAPVIGTGAAENLASLHADNSVGLPLFSPFGFL